MELVLIAAVSENNVIGLNGNIPWKIPEDMKRFKELTMGHPIIMGRKTFDSFPRKPLPGRMNILLTRSPEKIDPIYLRMPDFYFATSLDHALRLADEDAFDLAYVIGGEKVYREAIDRANRLEITYVHQVVQGDTFFPEIRSDTWKEDKREGREGYSFVSYKRI